MTDRLSKLLTSFEKHISIPWPAAVSAHERTIFLVYNKQDELKLRARVGEFELASTQSNHPWTLLDLTHGFELWMSDQDYKETYFEDPEYLEGLYDDFADELVNKLIEQVNVNQSKDSVIALLGCGTLFGFASVSGVVEALANKVTGRLVVFFPGEVENNNYQLLDAKDGWGYHATAITATV
ncbi:BREX protein BrxB domain-containing protein [Marinomonas sp. ef1]|uniref:BREX protein BrxB domain-containing protein n=1 Tax=Marinomonas sp. ef1 TaxID=2005043 RepID=UPI000C2874D9|nr:BREX protein BrxB domain-containing protein [Marinomonas sp. ef1]